MSDQSHDQPHDQLEETTGDATGATTGWGVLAPGRIAESFCRDLALVPGARLVASGSRSLDRAEAFVADHGGRAHGSYAALVADPEVDVVYVASPHAFHEEHVMLALEAGKAVLCEKPMTLDAASSERLFVEAERRGLFLMEAMWTACHPVVRELLALLGTPTFGTPRQVHADLGFPVRRDPSDRLLDPALGGGALVDMGIYPLTLAHLVLGEPESLAAVGTLAESGVDLDVAIAGRYAGGAVAALTCSMTAASSRGATIATDRGLFDLGRDFHHPVRVLWRPEEGEGRWLTSEEPVIGRGYGNEALEVQRCLAQGRLTSTLVPPSQTLSVMRQLDDVRRQIGMHYDVGTVAT